MVNAEAANGDLDPDLLNIPAGVLILLVSSSKLV